MKFATHNLNIGYAEQSLIKRINFEAVSGDFIVLVGKNGTGKSTLLKTLSGIISKISGDILIDNTNTQDILPKDLSKKISIVLTEKIEIDFTVKEVLQLGRHAYTNVFDYLKPTDFQVIDNIVKALDIEHLLHKNIQKISDGERQKVMIARSLIQETPIILLDEPTTHLDLENKAILLKLLLEISAKQNKIIIISTHDLNLVLPIAKKIWVIDKDTFEVIEQPEQNYERINKLFNKELIEYHKDCQSFTLKLSK